MTLRLTRKRTAPTFHGRFLREKDDAGGGGTDENDDANSDDTMDSDDDSEDDDSDSDEPADDSDSATGVKHRDGKPVTQEDFDKLTNALRRERRKSRGKEKDDTGTGEPSVPVATVKNIAARSALISAGLALPEDRSGSDRVLKRALKLLDLSDVDIDPETGEAEGIEDAIDDLKADFPELFPAPRKRAGGRADTTDRDGRRRRSGRDTTKMSATEIQGAMLRGEL